MRTSSAAPRRPLRPARRLPCRSPFPASAAPTRPPKPPARRSPALRRANGYLSAGSPPMRIALTKPLFAWDCLEDSPSQGTIRAFLESIPDGPLLYGLRLARGRGRVTYTKAFGRREQQDQNHETPSLWVSRPRIPPTQNPRNPSNQVRFSRMNHFSDHVAGRRFGHYRGRSLRVLPGVWQRVPDVDLSGLNLDHFFGPEGCAPWALWQRRATLRVSDLVRTCPISRAVAILT